MPMVCWVMPQQLVCWDLAVREEYWADPVVEVKRKINVVMVVQYSPAISWRSWKRLSRRLTIRM